jgi:hypothetical protein
MHTPLWRAFGYRIGASDRFDQLNGCLCRQPLPGRASQVKVRFDGSAKDPRPSKQI